MIVYRSATPDDKQAIWLVRTESIRELCKTHYTAAEIEAWSGTPMPEAFGDIIRTKEFFVAEREGLVIGFGFLDKEAGQIDAIFIAPASVRQGIGSALLGMLERTAREAGSTSLRLSASLNAVAFYNAAGYRAEKEATWQHPSGFALPCVHMQKTIGE
jgi:GNAT superfamily N-acetyltransferase